MTVHFVGYYLYVYYSQLIPLCNAKAEPVKSGEMHRKSVLVKCKKPYNESAVHTNTPSHSQMSPMCIQHIHALS